MQTIARTVSRARYVAAQGVRVAWYMGHYYLARRLSGPFNRPGEPKFQPKAAGGDPARIRAAFLALFAKDRANIEQGVYPPPENLGLEQALEALRDSVRFFADLPKVDTRRLNRDGDEVRGANDRGDRYPAYYLQNFHYQTGGWLSPESAKLYDTQVEVLFGGAADAMRRIALGSLARALKGKDQRRLSLIDIACGNGRFLGQILKAYPKLGAMGVDLSPAYVAAARERLAPWPQVEVAVGQAERMPCDDASFDAATCVYLLHELPPNVRRDVAREAARVVKSGGVLVVADSLQTGDAHDLDRMLEYFPVGFHEPYFGSYLDENLEALFGEAGFELEETEFAFLTKVMRFRRVGRRALPAG